MKIIPSRRQPSSRLRAFTTLVAAALVIGVLTVPLGGAEATAATTPEFSDSFDGARDADPTYGLNDSISTRQSGPGKGVTYTRLHGEWTSPPAAPPNYASQVNHPDFPGKLSFWARNSAVRLDAPAMTDAADSYSVTAKVDPNANSLGAAGDWVSLMLAKSSGSTGYVTAATVDAGITVSRNGKVMLYQRGTALWPSELVATRSASGFDVSVTVTSASSAAPSIAVIVNGATRTTALSGALPQPYVLLGAYLSNGSATVTAEVSTVESLTVSRVAQYADSFDGANVYAADYGLNQNLAARQPGLPMALTYSRVAGHWSNTAAPPATYSQVNNPSFANQLSFWVAPSAVRFDSPVLADSTGAFEVRTKVRPDPGLFGSADDWVSIMLSSSRTGRGYVTDAANQFSMTVARNGKVSLYRGGALATSFTTSAVSGAYSVSIRATDAGATPDLIVTVNGVSRTTSLTAALKKPYLYLGAYISNGSETQLREVSTVDDLTISRVDPFPTLQYFGTYGTRNDDLAGDHVPDMDGIANIHWINVSPTLNASPLTYDTSVFASCPPRSCIVYVGSEFFKPQTPSQAYPDLTRWQGYVQMLQPYKDKIAAYYLQDEAYMYGVTYAQLDWSAKAVQASINSGALPDLPIMFTMTYSDIAASVAVPPEVDWYGMDAYNMTETELEWSAVRLEQMASDPADRIYLFPPNVPDTWNVWTTESQILARQYEYLRVANRHPRIVALLNFGLWVNTGAGGSSPRPQTYVPRVFDLQERVGTSIMSRP